MWTESDIISHYEERKRTRGEGRGVGVLGKLYSPLKKEKRGKEGRKLDKNVGAETVLKFSILADNEEPIIPYIFFNN